MKYNFIQKKGVVVALAAALSVASFGVTALAGISFKPVGTDQSVWFQSNQSVDGKLTDGQAAVDRISLDPNHASVEVSVELYAKDNQSTAWDVVKVSGDDCITINGCVITATGNGKAVFALKKGSGLAVKTWEVTASGWSTGGGSSSSGGSSSGGGVGGGGAVVTKPDTGSTTTASTISKNPDGSMTLVDASGKAVVNAKATIDGKSYLSDATGKVITSAFATTPKGNKVYCGADGAIIQNKTFTVDGKKYLASKTGKIVTNKIATTPKGNMVYCGADGAIVQNKTFTVGGKKYFASKTGKIITNKITTTPKGNLVYCTKTGAIKTNAVFKVGGKKYIAKKSGALYTSRWVTIKNTKYYCDKNGVVTKTKAIKK